MSEEITVHHLEMCERPTWSPPLPEGLRVSKLAPPDPRFNARMYRQVGGDWKWRELLVWSEDDWARFAARPEFHTWVGFSNGSEIGYFEIEQQEGGNAEIVHFGLVPDALGQGLGRALLNEAIRVAWELPGTCRVWLHTCSNDHPAALQNYRRRGFEVFKTEIERKG